MQRPQARRFGLRALAGALTVVLCGALIAGAQEEPLPPTDVERVAFVGSVAAPEGFEEEHRSALQVMRRDGTDRSPLLTGEARTSYYGPQWSPDGTHLVVTEVGWEQRRALAVPADGSAPHVLDDTVSSVSWSADGRTIAWSKSTPAQIVVAEVVATVPELVLGEQRVIPLSAAPGRPRFSPDGRRLLFGLNGSVLHTWELWTVNVDGSDLRQLTPTPVNRLLDDSTYGWSPDGSTISFITASPSEARLIAADGTDERALYPHGCGQQLAIWSPGGSYLAIDGGCSPYTGLLLVDTSGQLRGTLAPDRFQSWLQIAFSPDGSGLYAVAQEGVPGVLSPDRGRHDVYRIPLNGAPFQRLTFDGMVGMHLAVFGLPVALPDGDLPPLPVLPTAGPSLPPPGEETPAPVDPSGDEDGFTQACPRDRVPDSPFADIPDDNVHRPGIACMAWWQVVYGITPSRYGPGVQTTRAQMASLLARLIEEGGGRLPETTADYFLDDSGSVHESNINRLAEAGVLRGSGERLYHPQMQVQRDQMASFVSAAYEHLRGTALPEPQRDQFIDDDRSVHERRINQAAEEGLVAGIDQLHYAPARPERRDQAATRSARVVDLMVEQGKAAPPE